MESWIIRYQVKLKSEGNEMPTMEKGIVCAENYCKAVEKLENFYGLDLLEIYLLKRLTANLMILPNSILKDIEEYCEI